MTEDLFTSLSTIDWTDLPAVAAASRTVLDALDHDRGALQKLVDAAVTDPGLTRLHEHYDILDKIVIHDDPTGWRLRLHVFLPGYFDRPHTHRWDYVSRVLDGSYQHTLYGTADQFGDADDLSGVDPRTLTARMVRTESAGSTYTLHHSMIHSVVAADWTTTLIVRGPAVTDRFVVSDRENGTVWWQYGAAQEDPAAQAAKRMSAAQVTASVQGLHDRGIFG
jgi:hypothetical protein